MTMNKAEARRTIESLNAVGSPVDRPVRPLYAERDHEAQGRYYTRHIDAMTREGLHAKSAIAGELAHRDLEIAVMQMELENLQDSYGQLMAENVRLRADAMVMRELLRNSQTAVCVANRTLVLDDLPGKIAEALSITAYLKA